MFPHHCSLSQVVYHPEKGFDFTITEVRVIQYAICDYNVKEIAHFLDSTEKNVYRHRSRIMDKTTFHSFEGLIAMLLINQVFTGSGAKVD